MASIVISGGFDPIHIGHVRLIHDATQYGNVVVLLNSDDWLLRKKGYKFMDWMSRAYILRSIKGVVAVEPVDDRDGSVCEGLERIRPDYFANGGDRTQANTPEKELCERLGIQLLWNIGGEKVESSSELVAKAKPTWIEAREQCRVE